jgi:hypothetical protein
MPIIIRDKACDCHPETCGCAPCELVLDGDVVARGDRHGLERLQARFAEQEIAVAQAVTLAQYVEDRAKGAMVDAARVFLSTPFAHEIAERLKAGAEVAKAGA